jgi:intraflagellar transport protein 140
VFATEEAGLLLQEYQDLDPVSSGCIGFLGVSAPHLLLLKGSAAGQQLQGSAVDRSRSSSSNGSNGSLFAAVPLRCFSGLADADDATRRALLDFNYLLAVGRLDEAFRVVSALKSPAVWRNMAHMAIKNKQLAVAGGWGCGWLIL